jgi:hypothetical protein
MAKGEELSYEIVKHLGKLGEANKGWQVEVNMIKWGNAKEAKLDIRKWNRLEERMGKGITLTDDEWGELLEILEDNR